MTRRECKRNYVWCTLAPGLIVLGAAQTEEEKSTAESVRCRENNNFIISSLLCIVCKGRFLLIWMRLAHLFLSLEKDDIFIHLPSSAKSNLQRSCYINHGAAHRLPRCVSPELNGINYSFTACVVLLLRYDTCKSPLIVSRKIVKLYSHRSAGRQHVCVMCVFEALVVCVYISHFTLWQSSAQRSEKEKRVWRDLSMGARFKLSWLESLVRNLWPAGPDEKADQKKLGAGKIGPNFN